MICTAVISNVKYMWILVQGRLEYSEACGPTSFTAEGNCRIDRLKDGFCFFFPRSRIIRHLVFLLVYLYACDFMTSSLKDLSFSIEHILKRRR